MSLALPIVVGTTVLRPFRRTDANGFFAYRNDAVLARYQGWSPMDAAAADAFVARMDGVTALAPDDWIQLAIATAEADGAISGSTALAHDTLVGDVGLHWQPAEARVEIGFTLARTAHGHGHASRAVQAAMRWCAAAGVQTMQAVTDARNTASMAVLGRTGFEFVEARPEFFKGEHCVEYVFRRALSRAS